MSGGNGKHKRALNILSHHPKYIGIPSENVRTVSIEQRLYHNGALHAEVDLVFELNNGDYVLVEYKSNNDKKLIKKGKHQLEKGIDFFKITKGVSVEGILVTGDCRGKLSKPFRRKYTNNSRKKN